MASLQIQDQRNAAVPAWTPAVAEGTNKGCHFILVALIYFRKDIQMNSYLLFHEYVEGTVALKSEYVSLLQEHLGANKEIDFREQWALLCGYSNDKMEWLQSVCNVPYSPIQEKYTELYRLWFQLRYSNVSFDSTFSSFRPFVCALAQRESLNCPEDFYLPEAKVRFLKICKHSLEVLEGFYKEKVDQSGVSCFEYWLADIGYSMFFSEYPILFRLLTDSFLSLIINLKLILKRLEHDRQRISERFGISHDATLSMLDSEFSDQHNHGQCVSILSFDDGKKLVYKPHSLATDMFWNSFVKLFNTFSPSSPLYAAKVLDCGDYGYEEFIKYMPTLTEIQCVHYFERCGTLLSVLSVLGGSDFHYENLIISNGYPILVDMETLITPWVKRRYATESGASGFNQPSLSISQTLLLSKWVGKTADGAVNIGAFCSYGVSGQNLLCLDGNKIVTASEYPDAILRGFREGNRILQLNSGIFIKMIDDMKDTLIRFVLRNTRTYYELLNYFTNLRGLRDGSAYECVTSRLYAAFLLSCDKSTLSQILPAIQSEQTALKQRDIPLFYSRGDSTALFDSDGSLLVSDFFEISPIDIVKRNLSAINHTLTEVEAKYIRTTLHLHTLQNNPIRLSTWSYADCIRHRKPPVVSDSVLSFWIKNAYNAIQRNTLDKHDFIFYAPIRNVLNGRYELKILDNSLYNGRYGILCFLILYADYTKNSDLLQNVERFIQDQLNNLLERKNVNYLLNLSFTDGLAGLFLLIRNFCIVTHKQVANQTNEVIRRITPAQIQNCPESDYFNGLSGLLYTICSLCSLSPMMYSDCVDIIRCIIDVILSRRGKHGWFDSVRDYAPLTGLAHGQIGYSLALASALPFASDKTTIVPIIKESLNYELNLIDLSCFNLPDYRRFQVKLRDASPAQYVPRFMHGNCSGIIGSVATALKIHELLKHNIPTFAEELHCEVWFQAVRNYLDKTELVGNDSFCCGTASWLDLLNTLRKIPKYNAWANRSMWSIISSLNDGGIVFNSLSSEIEDISLFKGITGIGYSALRMKGTYPSVLF